RVPKATKLNVTNDGSLSIEVFNADFRARLASAEIHSVSLPLAPGFYWVRIGTVTIPPNIYAIVLWSTTVGPQAPQVIAGVQEQEERKWQPSNTVIVGLVILILLLIPLALRNVVDLSATLEATAAGTRLVRVMLADFLSCLVTMTALAVSALIVYAISQ